MPKTKTIPRLNVGDKVRVCSGVCDPDYDDLTIGGWARTIVEVQNGTPPTFLTGPCQSKTFSITVLGLLDPNDFPGDEYGLFCQVRRDSSVSSCH